VPVGDGWCADGDGRKELVALTYGHRESADSWADLLRSCRRRQMAAPVLAIGRRRS
jgi:putative transposase